MEIDILIDGLTDCLIERATGELVETEWKMRSTPIKPNDYRGWQFKWNKTDYPIYELFIKGKSEVEGRIAFEIDGGVADVDIVESAPHNKGHNGIYKGVGGHLFAIACLESQNNGCDGVVAFTSKTGLVEYYQRELNATILRGQRMVILEDAAQILLDKYIRK